MDHVRPGYFQCVTIKMPSAYGHHAGVYFQAANDVSGCVSDNYRTIRHLVAMRPAQEQGGAPCEVTPICVKIAPEYVVEVVQQPEVPQFLCCGCFQITSVTNHIRVCIVRENKAVLKV